MSDWPSPTGTRVLDATPTIDTTTLPHYRVARAQALSMFERSYLRRLMEATGGNASAAARIANMDRPYLLSLLRRHGLR